MIIQNNGKNPNDLHDFLMQNNCVPICLRHDAIYDENGVKAIEATEIFIEIEAEKLQQLTDLIHQFMA